MALASRFILPFWFFHCFKSMCLFSPEARPRFAHLIIFLKVLQLFWTYLPSHLSSIRMHFTLLFSGTRLISYQKHCNSGLHLHDIIPMRVLWSLPLLHILDETNLEYLALWTLLCRLKTTFTHFRWDKSWISGLVNLNLPAKNYFYTP